MFHRSQRLLFRPGWIEDAPELTARIADEFIVRNVADAPWPYREADARAWLGRPEVVRHPRFLLTLPQGEGTTIVGACAISPGAGGAMLDFWIARPWWGRGLASEALRALREIARPLGHERLRARHSLDNPAAARVLARAGFRPTGAVIPLAVRSRASVVLARECETALIGDAGESAKPVMPCAA